MSDYRLYPRLSPELADPIRAELIRSDAPAQFNRGRFEEALSSADAFPATGGRRMAADELMEMRQGCVEAVADTDESNSLTTSMFDLRLGRALFQQSADSAGEFGNSKVWDFITLVLLPDIATERFSGMSSDIAARFTGGHRRHVFQRLWRRWNVLGEDFVLKGALTEDDYQALLERRMTSERKAVALKAAQAIVGSKRKGSRRREYTRVFARQLFQVSGIVDIGEDDEANLDALIEHVKGITETLLKGR